MKKLDVFALLTEFALALVLTLGAMGFLISGFDLRVEPVFYLAMLLACAVTVLGTRFRWAWLANLGIFALYLWFLWGRGLSDQLLDLVKIIGQHYYVAYGLDLNDLFASLSANVGRRDVTMACCACGGFVGILVSLVIAGRMPAWFSLPVLMLPVGLSLVVIDTVPEPGWIFLLFMGVSLLLMTQTARRRHQRQGAKLTVLLTLPISLAVSCLLLAVPRQGYEKPDMEKGLAEIIYDIADFFSVPTVGGEIWQIEVPKEPVDQIHLGQIRPGRDNESLVMTARPSFSGALYLRGRGYATYTGSVWSSDNNMYFENFTIHREYMDTPEEEEGSAYVNIHAQAENGLLFVPYYGIGVSLQQGYVPNDGKLEDYSFYIRRLRSDWAAQWNRNNGNVPISEYEGMALDQYTALPPSTLERAREYLKELRIYSNTTIPAAVNAIDRYVRGSAAYSLEAPAMPAGTTDFAMWFLDEGETGYCVHFASAATVLLRAAGIPARYVEGYYTYAPEADQTCLITEAMAHAWVEYYVPGLGWMILDATPAADEELPPEPTTEPSTAPTTQPTTQNPSTESTAPTTAPTTEPSTTAPTTQPTTQNPSTESTAPTTQAPTTEPSTAESLPNRLPPREEEPLPWGWILGIVGCLLAVSLVIGQWILRITLRRRSLATGSPNQRALKMWRYARLLSRLDRQVPPARLLHLANKAKYSQHTLEAEELLEFEAYFGLQISRLKKQNLFCRLVNQLIFAAY